MSIFDLESIVIWFRKLLIDASGCPNSDTAKALVSYYILESTPNSWAEDWYEGNYASVLFPKADMDDKRISEFLKAMGSEEIQRSFYGNYIGTIVGSDPTVFLIDSTGVPNSIRMPITGINNHNGQISLETRLILVCRKSDRMPIFLRYVPGNIIDSGTLIRTIDEVRAYGLDPEYTIIDAGYCTLENMIEMLEMRVGFITRLKRNLEIYKDMVGEYLSDLTPDRRIIHNDRFMRVVSKEQRIGEHGGKIWLHLIMDEDMKNAQEKTFFIKYQAGEIDSERLDECNRTAGIFILVSTWWMEPQDIIRTYFERGGIEQLIDVGKSDSRLSEAAIHSEECFKGKLLMEFIALAVNQALQNHFKARKEFLSSKKRKNKDAIPGRNLSPAHALSVLRNQKCKVFENVILPSEPTKSVNDVYRLVGFECPKRLERTE